MPLVPADYDPKKTFFALDLESFRAEGLVNAPEFLAYATVEAIVTRRRKDLGTNTVGNARFVFEPLSDRWGEIKTSDFTLDDLMENTTDGRLTHAFSMDWDGKVLDTLGRRVSLDEVNSMAEVFQAMREDLPNVPEGYAGWYSHRS